MVDVGALTSHTGATLVSGRHLRAVALACYCFASQLKSTYIRLLGSSRLIENASYLYEKWERPEWTWLHKEEQFRPPSRSLVPETARHVRR